MKQVLVRRGGTGVGSVPAPLVEPGCVLVEVAYSLISTGTEITTLGSAKTSLLRQALEQPDKVTQVIEYCGNPA